MELKTYFAQDAAGNIISSAIVNVFLQGTTTLATGLTRADGTPLENPFAADGAGRIQFRAPDGYYDVQVSAGPGIIQTLTIQCVDYSEAKADADRAEADADRAEADADRAEAAADRADVSAEQAQNALNSITEINTNFEQNSREQWSRSLAEAGLTLVSGSFEEGATANSSTDAVWHIGGGQCYTWGGAFPKAVPAESTPTSTGGVDPGAWVSVGGASLRADLSSSDGAGLIGVSSGGTVQGSLSDIENSIKHSQPLSNRRIVAIAHRGYSETYLEQTLMAYSQCNADVLEVDMQTTSDGYAVCFHDNDLSPATVGGSGAVKDNTYSTVSTLRFTRTVGTRYADMAGIPTLGAVCRIAMRRGKMIHAEIKGYRTLADCALYSSIIDQYGLSPYTTFSCFDFAPLAYTHNINPRITYALELNSYDSGMDANIAELASWGGSVLSINKSILSTIGNSKLREWEAMGLTLAAWTVYTAEQMQTVANYGIRLIYLDKDFYNIIG